ncbi:uncharacterized protein C8Q71DRAFT_855858 [Rhodofomes roseus]|uniref:F-box domain-containing protein n=1 Tax=Rhodofomes roseus TaxID=34475 RepID=A0A4Y9XSB0_9APHY|nr:uncharacterized protein C8Q71DRAFT_855858 [Rhodofomes roseus]KAH9839225.1 hypothetical protein C8Q71DRAFT_855858 [Rhodofomes roseus]TFY51419.1 hypothetical protein EVJ58_g10578 [Rhodofomes roseus]
MPRKKIALGVDVNPGDAPPKKEGGRRNLRGKRGGLKDMPTMPLDILLEIFCHLEPRDLLNLARTTKPFRAFLLSRNSATMWKAARVNVEGLPDCPPRLSEPAYANLAFFPYCHNCLKPNVQTILWEFGTRYCPPCVKTLTISAKAIYFEFKYSWAMSLRFEGALNKVFLNRQEVYHCRELDRLKVLWESTREDNAKWTGIVTQEKTRIEEIYKHSVLCRAWDRKRVSNRSAELQDIREQRLTTIVAKLRDLGWGEELDCIADFEYRPLSEHAQVRPSKVLTERAWAKIQDEVVQHMQEIKEARLRRERRTLIRRRLMALKSAVTAARTAPPKRTAKDECKPKFQDLAMMPDFRPLVEAPNEDVVDQATFDALMPRLCEFEERWQRECMAELRAILGVVEVGGGVDALDLAATLFQCKECKRYMLHPEILAHECLSPFLDMPEIQAKHGDYFEAVIELSRYRMPWSAARIIAAPCLDHVRTIIERCGRDPKVTTQKDMDDADLRVLYASETSLAGAKVMSWRRAIKYVQPTSGRYFSFNPVEWRMATDKEKAAVKDREDKRRTQLKVHRSGHIEWRCGYCDIARVSVWSLISQQDSVTAHVKQQHGIENPTLDDGDIYWHPDSDMELQPIPVERQLFDEIGFIDWNI